MADGADLAQLVGDGEEGSGAGEELALEIRAQAEGHHRDAQPVGDAGELPNLLVGEELGFVDEDAVDFAGQRVLADAVVEVVAIGEGLGLRCDAQARADHADAVLGIERGGHQQRTHAAFAVVVGRLQQHGRLARIHGGVGEVELGHGALSPTAGGRTRRGRAALTGFGLRKADDSSVTAAALIQTNSPP